MSSRCNPSELQYPVLLRSYTHHTSYIQVTSACTYICKISILFANWSDPAINPWTARSCNFYYRLISWWLQCTFAAKSSSKLSSAHCCLAARLAGSSAMQWVVHNQKYNMYIVDLMPLPLNNIVTIIMALWECPLVAADYFEQVLLAIPEAGWLIAVIQ